MVLLLQFNESWKLSILIINIKAFLKSFNVLEMNTLVSRQFIGSWNVLEIITAVTQQLNKSWNVRN